VETRLKSDEALVKRLLPHINRDPEDRATAWEEWYNSIGAASVLAYVKTKNDTAELDTDILQEAIAIAYAEVERGRYEPRAGIPFTAYVKGIARNKIREARRRARRLVTVEDPAASFLDRHGQHNSVQKHHLEAVVERHERLTSVWKGIAKLPSRRRRVLESYLRGQSTEEIATALGISTDSVRQHKSRGLRSLRQHLR
jgi:RNA polymerase sigma factor (sigma-70 family)